MNSGYISKTGKKVEQPADDAYKKVKYILI